MTPNPITELLKRRETIAFIVATLMSAIAATQLPQRAGLPLPEAALGQLTTSVWLIFVGFFVEGKFRGAGYTGDLKTAFTSSRFRLFYVQGFVLVVNAFLPEGFKLPEEALTGLGQFVVAGVLGLTTGDVVQTLRLTPSISGGGQARS